MDRPDQSAQLCWLGRPQVQKGSMLLCPGPSGTIPPRPEAVGGGSVPLQGRDCSINGTASALGSLPSNPSHVAIPP